MNGFWPIFPLRTQINLKTWARLKSQVSIQLLVSALNTPLKLFLCST